jgi:Family of unknown function (DUF695)
MPRLLLVALAMQFNPAIAQPAMSNEATGIAAPWVQFEFEKGGERIAIGVREPLSTPALKASFPYHVQISYSYDKVGSNRLPNTEEWNRIRAYQGAIERSLQERKAGILVFAMGSDGLYQWNVYAKSGREVEIMLISALPSEKKNAGKPIVLIEFGSEIDREWKYAEQIQPLVNQLNSASEGQHKP